MFARRAGESDVSNLRVPFMRIDCIELYHVAMPLIYPWRTAYGEDVAVHSVLCRLSSGSASGWGESSPLAAPCYSPEWAGGVFATVRDWLGPAIVARNVNSGDELQQLLGVYKGNPFAKAVLDTAWWGLSQQITGQPLHEAWGARRDQVPVGADFGIMDTIDELLTSIGEAVDAGFARVKLKFRPGWDVEMVRAVRRQHPTFPLHVDCNSGYTLDDLPMFQALDEFELAMIEQPLAHDDLVDHATLQRQIKTPVCLDESITSPRRAAQAIALASGQFLNVKPGRVGGLTNAVMIHDLARDAGVPCWVGGMLESSTGASHCAALAMLNNFTYPADIFPSSRFYHEDLSDPPLELLFTAGKPPSILAPHDIPAPVPKRLKKLTVQQATIRS